MRTLLVFISLMSSLLLEAQTQKQSFTDSSYAVQHMQSKKWFFTSYSNIGVEFNFMNGSTATVISAPIGLQLNRQLNNNFYAFAGVSAAPTYVNFNHSFLSPGVIKSNSGNAFKSDYFGLYSSVNMGLMYVNDARTFSISGSVGVSRSAYPMMLYPTNMQHLNTFIPPPVYR